MQQACTPHRTAGWHPLHKLHFHHPHQGIAERCHKRSASQATMPGESTHHLT